MHIAPCGMNCSLCRAYQRRVKPCPGCAGPEEHMPKYCARCRIRHCAEPGRAGAKFCHECPSYPCALMKRLDARYRSRYGMSMLENLDSIARMGKAAFVKSEKKRWACPACGGILCVHHEACPSCSGRNPHFPG
ncbi:MAG: DUF3795 domain-containing protein [Spirochaetes bacterium]|nr:MAG: DUF3795 domain-containing protein [Spirochaetota bacterium]